MERIQVKVPPKDKETLSKVAEDKGIPLSKLVRRLLSKAIREKHYEQV